MTSFDWLALAYAASWLITAAYWWLQYLDVRTTLRNMAQRGDIELNPAMKPYVKPGDFWLMMRGKVVNGGWIGIASIFFPPCALLCLIYGYSTWKDAVHPNEQLANRQKIPGDASTTEKGR